jgi:REP element-mobilizing transposase RayT
LYVHLVWATWDRLPLLVGEVERVAYADIATQALALHSEVLEIGGIEDHVHVLVRFPTTVAVSQLAKQMKGSSSHLIGHRVDRSAGFKWQGGYGAFTVSKPGVQRVRDYIRAQREHHVSGTLDDDLEAIWIDTDDAQSAQADFV